MPAIVLPKQPPSQGPIMIRGHFHLATWSDAGMKTGIDRLHRWAMIIATAAPLAGIVILAAAA